jgi:hypothetical protein
MSVEFVAFQQSPTLRLERSKLVDLVQRDNANTGETRARNPWRSVSVGAIGGWRLLLDVMDEGLPGWRCS